MGETNPLQHYPYTVFVEGPSCSGKSTILRGIESPTLLPIYKKWVSASIFSRQYFLERDEDKLTRAQVAKESNRYAEAVMVDRGYLSTLVFYHVLQEQRGIPVYPVLEWFITNIGETLYRPDAYVFVDVPPSITLKRAQTARKVDDNNMWLLFPDRIQYWYEKLYVAFEAGIPRHSVDGTLPTELAAQKFKEALQAIRCRRKNDES